MSQISHGLPFDTDKSSPIIVDIIYRLKIRDVMSTDVIVCPHSATMEDAQVLMRENAISGLPVMDGERLAGIISVDDVIQALVDQKTHAPVHDYMSRQVIVLEDDMPLSFGISWLDRYHYGRFPVLNNRKEMVGIITSRDIIVTLLLEMNREIERFEEETKDTAASTTGFHLEYSTRPFDFEMAGRLSTETKRELKERGLPPKVIRRVAVATYELEMNQVVHAQGGTVRVTYDGKMGTVEIHARDRGPGIPDVEAALREGFSTATDWIRSLGFGAGMGLPNTQRVADVFSIDSTIAGTNVMVTIRTTEES